MKHAIIDIGSTSTRLTLYDIKDNTFKIMFKEKILSEVASYVDDGILSEDGIECICSGLESFMSTLEIMNEHNVSIFATASLRNIKNSKEAVEAIHAATGLSFEVISGEEEALLGYTGAMREVRITDGVFVDIGGASTEIVSFRNGRAIETESFGVGSLNLYRRCVKKIIPGKGSQKRINKAVCEQLTPSVLSKFKEDGELICIGGTARAVLKITRKFCRLPENGSTITRHQLERTYNFLTGGSEEAVELILKIEPDRIHTMIPGIMILYHIVRRLDIKKITVSKYGVREGYLCQKILRANRNATSIPKTGN